MEEKDDRMLEFMITVLLADYDLMGLITYGDRPYDEYGPEARTILRYIVHEDYDVKLDVLASKIQYIFLCWFDVQPSIVPCIMLANEIKLML
jgi:hypothetical protein